MARRALIIILACIGVATGAAYVFDRMLKLWKRTALLIGAGTAICGNSAIVAVFPILQENLIQRYPFERLYIKVVCVPEQRLKPVELC